MMRLVLALAATALAAASLAAPASSAHAQPAFVLGQPAGSPVCTAEGPDAGSLTVRCEGQARPEAYTCTTLLLADAHPEPGLETVITCNLRDEGDQPAEGMVAIRTPRQVVWAMRRPQLSGARADALLLQHSSPSLHQILFHVSDEDSTELWIVGWTGSHLERVFRGVEAWGLADPETSVEVRYRPGRTAYIETTTRPASGRAVQRRYRWEPGTILFQQTSGPR